MTTFIIVAAVMVAAALAWVLWPLLRPASQPSVERRMVNLSVYKDQFADLDADFARGSITQDNYNEAKAELERRMLEEARAEKTAVAPAPVGGVKTAIVVAAAIPVLAGLLYVKLGAPDAFSPLATAQQDQHQLSGAQIDEMTTKLAARLEKEPDNVDGWVMLARTYYSQRKFKEAAGAYEKLTVLLPNEPDLYADYADALAMAQGKQLAGKPMELVNKALALDPNQWKALAMAGTDAFERKDYKAAVAHWEKLRDTSGSDSPIGKQIQASIDEARQLGGMPASTPPVAAASASGHRRNRRRPPRRKRRPPPAAQSVSGTVSLEKGLAGEGESRRRRLRVRASRRQQDADRLDEGARQGPAAEVHARRLDVDESPGQVVERPGSHPRRACLQVGQRDARQRRPRRPDQTGQGRMRAVWPLSIDKALP